MASLFKMSLPHPNGKENNEIKITVSFNRELTNWATSQPKKIGYYVNVVPVEVKKSPSGYSMESFMAFSGFNMCLLECDRQSNKRLEQAIAVVREKQEEFLNYFKPKSTDEKTGNG